MKRIILPTLLILLFTGISLAQFQLAPVTGLNISKVRTSNSQLNEVSYSNTNGFMGGLNAKYAFENRFNIQLEGAYSQKGYESKAVNASSTPSRQKL